MALISATGEAQHAKSQDASYERSTVRTWLDGGNAILTNASER